MLVTNSQPYFLTLEKASDMYDVLQYSDKVSIIVKLVFPLLKKQNGGIGFCLTIRSHPWLVGVLQICIAKIFCKPSKKTLEFHLRSFEGTEVLFSVFRSMGLFQWNLIFRIWLAVSLRITFSEAGVNFYLP